jgi:hypothetical protein
MALGDDDDLLGNVSATVGMPNGRAAFAFGISTRRTGGGKQLLEDIRFQSL